MKKVNVDKNIKAEKNNDKIMKDKIKRNLFHNIINLLIKIIFIVFLYFVLFHVVFGIERMKDDSMTPYVTDGDLLFFHRLDNKYNNDDLVVIKQNNKKFVSRIIAKENQTVDINDQGQLFIDGNPETHISYYKTLKDSNGNINYPYTVPKGCYFVLNDYRLKSNDSRLIGPISEENVIGKVIAKLQVRNF